MTRTDVVPMEQLAEAVRAGVVAAIEERETATVNGGILQIITPGFFPTISWE